MQNYNIKIVDSCDLDSYFASKSNRLFWRLHRLAMTGKRQIKDDSLRNDGKWRGLL